MEIIKSPSDETTEDVLLQRALEIPVAKHAEDCMKILDGCFRRSDLGLDPTIIDTQRERFSRWMSDMNVDGKRGVSLDYKLRFDPAAALAVIKLIDDIRKTITSSDYYHTRMD